MTDLALRGSGYVNGVAMSHWEVSRDLFPDYKVHAITNGVHVAHLGVAAVPDALRPLAAGLAPRFALAALRDPHPLRRDLEGAPEAKRALVETVNRESNAGFDLNVLTLGFARRATAYKRAALIVSDLERLRRISAERGRLQLVFAGKAHPRRRRRARS